MNQDQPVHRESPEGRLAEPTVIFDLNNATEQLRREPAWQTGDRNAKTLFKKPDLRVVLLTLKTGARMEKHQAPGPITVHLLAGRLRLQLADRAVDLGTGEILSLDGGLTHDVEALDQSTFLLTVAGPVDEGTRSRSGA
jgi:quercetin dioxygenase-like cupin family protein